MHGKGSGGSGQELASGSLTPEIVYAASVCAE